MSLDTGWIVALNHEPGPCGRRQLRCAGCQEYPRRTDERLLTTPLRLGAAQDTECALVIVSKLWNHVVYSCSAGEVLA